MFATQRLVRVPPFERGITLGDFLVPIRLGERIGSRTRHLALVVLGTLLITLGAYIRIPTQPVPITGQTLAVLLVGASLGFRRGLGASLLYLALGIIGLPVFADERSGAAMIATFQEGRLVLGATGGYLLGFVVASALVGILAEAGWDRGLGGSIAAMAIGNAMIYAIGLPWLAVALGLSLERTLAAGLYPFVGGDVLKLLLAAGLLPVGWWIVRHRDEGSAGGERDTAS
ncbi:MAG: biotin transporter BioY [Chloroflexi bacterium]|nr:biotin transporter BioY [Chloroflexota bacterium]